MNYSDKLKDPRWQKKRLEVFSRDNFTCLCCGSSSKTLHIHHRYYMKVQPWEYPSEALDTLCCDCHAYVEGLKQARKQVYRAGERESDASFDDSFKDPEPEVLTEAQKEEKRKRDREFDDGFSDSFE